MIKTTLLSAVLMTSALLQTNAHADIKIPGANGKIQTGALKDVYAGVKFNYLDHNDRIMILQDFFRAVELEYALLPLKKERINLDYTKLKADAIAKETAVEDVLLSDEDRKNDDARSKVTFLQASSNMDFLDRMIAIVAQFKDTHFSIQEKISRPYIYSGVRLFRIGGKIVVGSLENKFLAMASKLSGNDLSIIKIGDEVVSIDGVPVEDKVNEYKSYVSGSSDEFIDSTAVRALTLRNFKYEKKNYIRVVFKNAGTIKLPVFANTSMTPTSRLDAVTYFKKFEIPTDSTFIGVTFDPTTKQWQDSNLNFAGYAVKNFGPNLKGTTDYIGESGSAAIRTGYYMQKGKSYAVLQVYTFSSATVKKGDTQMPFLDALRNFVMEVKESELPLILDLRSNNGGNGSYPDKLLRMITPEKAVYAPSTTAMRMTQYMRQINEQDLYQSVIAENENEGMTIDLIQNMVDHALDTHADYTPMYVYGPTITADPKVGGFNNDVVALISADCVSACDKTAFLLKSSKRALIIGTHSNGTGAGFMSTEDLNTTWSDPLKVFSTTIPNYLFGIPGDKTETLVYEEGSASRLCSENKPTVADIQYSAGAIDLMKANSGWLQVAAAGLDAIGAAHVVPVTPAVPATK